MLLGNQAFPRESMKKITMMLPWGKRKPESRLLLPSTETEAWDHILPLSDQQQASDSGSTPCWPFFKWITSRTRKNRTSCCSVDQELRSKVHPLSSRMIRKRNSHPSRRENEDDAQVQKNVFSSSWSSVIGGVCGKTRPKEEQPSPNRREKKRPSTAQPKCKWGLGLGVIDMWPTNTCKFGSHAHNLKSIITTPSSWRWFQSSNSMLQDFLEDTEILKNMDMKDLNEYRELLLNEPLTYDRLQHYPKLVLRAFVFLLRNEEPPKSMKKKALIDLCTQWTCKNRNFFCFLESETNLMLQSGDEINSSKTRPPSKQTQKTLKPGYDKDGNLDAYSMGGFAAASIYKDMLHTSSRDDKIKLEDNTRFDEQEKLVGYNIEETINNWRTNDEAECSGITTGFEKANCPCFSCTSDDEFCHGCMCTICKDVGESRDTIFWMKCRDCKHMTHLQCAEKACYVGFVPDRKLDGEYWCHSCGAKEDLLAYWISWLREANQCDDMPRLELLLYYAMLVLKDTQRPKYKDLQMVVCEVWGQIVNGGHISNIQSLVRLICLDLDSTTDGHFKPNNSVNLHIHATDCVKKAEEDIAGVNETIQEVEAWRTVLSQTEEQLKRMELKLELKTKNALLSRAAAMIANKRLHETKHPFVNTQQEEFSFSLT